MSQFTDYGENKLIDFIRQQSMSLPTSWWLAPISAYTDASVTELTGIGLTRCQVDRSLTNFAGTQGDGTTLASSGASHTTSNNGSVALGTASGSGTLAGIGFFDASSGGNCWFVWMAPSPITINATDVVTLAAGTVKLQLGATAGCSDYLANKLIDLIFRAQSYSFPATIYNALYTTAPSNSGGGVEVGGGVNYSRASLACGLSTLSGTQGAGTTSASSGTGGRSSNNSAIAFPAPSGTWGTCVAQGWRDASSAGNLLFWGALTTSLSVDALSGAPTYPPDGMGFTFQ
jgi:hypothetical protein